MKRAFIMPLVLILMAMLLGVALVLSKIAEDKTNSLKSQETGYYSGKELTIKLVKADNENGGSVKDFFSHGLRTYYLEDPQGEDGKVAFNGASKYKNNYNKFLPALTVTHRSNSATCIETQDGNDAKCEADTDLWGKLGKLELPDFPSFSGRNVSLGYEETKEISSSEKFGKITLASKAEITFKKGEYHIKELSMGSPSNVYMEAGDYWIEGIETNDKSNIIPIGDGTVRIYTKQNNFKNGSSLNKNGNPSQLLIIAYEDFAVGNDNPVNGAIYGEKKVSIKNRGKVNGSIVARTVEFMNWDGIVVTYDSDVLDIDFGEVANWLTGGTGSGGEDDCW